MRIASLSSPPMLLSCDAALHLEARLNSTLAVCNAMPIEVYNLHAALERYKVTGKLLPHRTLYLGAKE